MTKDCGVTEDELDSDESDEIRVHAGMNENEDFVEADQILFSF